MIVNIVSCIVVSFIKYAICFYAKRNSKKAKEKRAVDFKLPGSIKLEIHGKFEFCYRRINEIHQNTIFNEFKCVYHFHVHDSHIY